MTDTRTIFYIDNQVDLDQLRQSISAARWLAMDTEFERRRTYFAKLCLIQIATEDLVACIDPLTKLDLSSLNPILTNTNCTKIIHSASQDLEVLLQCGLALPQPIFDTQMAAGYSGRGEQVSYAELVSQLLNISLSKAETQTDWTRRPLQQRQIDYALDDVRYLGAMYTLLKAQLEQLSRIEWFNEDSLRLWQKNKFSNNPEQAHLRLKRGGKLNLTAQRQLRSLAVWREKTAQQKNKPRQWIVKDKALYDIVQNRPTALSHFKRFESLDPGTIRRFGEEILNTLSACDEADSEQSLWPKVEKLNDDQKVLRRKMLKHIDDTADKLNISQSLLASRSDIEALIRDNDCPKILTGWRYDFAGKKLQNMLNDFNATEKPANA